MTRFHWIETEDLGQILQSLRTRYACAKWKWRCSNAPIQGEWSCVRERNHVNGSMNVPTKCKHQMELLTNIIRTNMDHTELLTYHQTHFNMQTIRVPPSGTISSLASTGPKKWETLFGIRTRNWKTMWNKSRTVHKTV